MYILYTDLDGGDAIVVTEFQYTALLGNLKYTHSLRRVSRHPDFFIRMSLDAKTITGVDFDDLPDPVKALIILYEI